MQKPNSVAIHPLVLLSVVDHFNRVVGKNRNQRVVGVLLGIILEKIMYYQGEYAKGKMDITNSYAVPFEEDLKEGGIWFLDHNYHETMYDMFRKINAREKVIGWYTTGTKIKSHDIEINEVFRKYCYNPVLVVIDVEHSEELGLPTEAYCAEEEITQSGEIIKKFVHIPSSVEAFEPEEIGVEHLLREIKDISINSLTNIVLSLKGMMDKINQMRNYVDRVLNGEIQANQQIISNVQEILNLLPNINSDELMKGFSAKNNDMLFVMYICSLSRSILSLHTLINNKLENKEDEKNEKIEKKNEKNNKDKKEKEKEKDKVK